MKIAYLGSGVFAKNILELLLNNSKINVSHIITQKAKPFGRKKEMLNTEVKNMVLERGLDNMLYECGNSKEILEVLEPGEVDFLCVCDYGVLLKQKVLDLPKKYALNVHGSLLPHLRGASPVQMTIFNQDKVAGVCVQQMVLKLDAGPVFMQDAVEVDFTETTPVLIDKLSKMGARILVETLEAITNDDLQPVEQNGDLATFCYKIPKEMGKIDFLAMDASEAFAAFRAFILWPGIYFEHLGGVYKILDCRVLDMEFMEDLNLRPGEFSLGKKQMFVGCKKGVLEILRIQPQGKKVMDASAFVAGYRLRF